MADYVLLRHLDIPDIDDLDIYLEHDGFEAFKSVVQKRTHEEVIDEVKTSGLRGRGGAGFPTGVKWSFLSPGVFPRYVVANADESEPGTFKDRELMERNPYQFLEGVAICSYAAQANNAYIYCRGEFWDLAHELERKIKLLHERKLLGNKLFGTDYDLDIHVHIGAGGQVGSELLELIRDFQRRAGGGSLIQHGQCQTGCSG